MPHCLKRVCDGSGSATYVDRRLNPDAGLRCGCAASACRRLSGYPDRYASMVDVLVNKTAWCIQIKSMGKKEPDECWDDGYGKTGPAGPYYDVEQPTKLPPCKRPPCPPPANPFAG